MIVCNNIDYEFIRLDTYGTLLDLGGSEPSVGTSSTAAIRSFITLGQRYVSLEID